MVIVSVFNRLVMFFLYFVCGMDFCLFDYLHLSYLWIILFDFKEKIWSLLDTNSKGCVDLISIKYKRITCNLSSY